MTSTEIRKAAILLNTTETCEQMLVDLGVGKVNSVLARLSKNDLIRYITQGIEMDLDLARDELDELGIE